MGLVTKPLDTGAELGKEVLLFINYSADDSATYEEPCWEFIGGQRTANMSDTRSELDASNKTSGEFGDWEVGIRTGEITADIVVYPKDTGYQQLKEAYRLGQKVDILRWHKKGESERFWCVVSEFSDETSYDDIATVSAKFKVTETPTYYKDMPDPRSTAALGKAIIGTARLG